MDVKTVLARLGHTSPDLTPEVYARVLPETEEGAWDVEKELISDISLPLNIRGNELHPFITKLKALRKGAIRQARELPVADEISTARST